MGLFGTKPKLQLSVDQQPIVAGRPITVRWSADGADRKVRGGRLELYYRNRYRYELGDEEGTRNSKRTVTVPVQTITLFTGEAPSGQQQTTIDLPSTPASAPKGVEWHLKLVMDRPGHDSSIEQTIEVLAPADGLAEWSSSPATSSGDECAIDMRVDDRAVRQGDMVRGAVDIRAAAPVSAHAIRVELVRSRREQDGIVKRDTTSVGIDKKVELLPGQQHQHRFEIAVPSDAEPSFQAERNSQHWVVRCVVDRRMKRDFVSEVEIVVYNAP